MFAKVKFPLLHRGDVKVENMSFSLHIYTRSRNLSDFLGYPLPCCLDEKWR